MPRHVIPIDPTTLSDEREQAVEQRDVTAGRDREVEIGDLARRGFAWIDHHDLGAARHASGRQPLIEHWMTPREIGTDEHDEIGLFQILVGAGHGIRTERALMASDGRGHA